MPIWRRWIAPPEVALAVVLAAAPAAVVLQHRALAPMALGGLLVMIASHRVHRGAWPWPPRSMPAWIAVALLTWGVAAVAWSPVPGRAVTEAARLAAFVLLAAMAARAAAALDAPARRRVGRGLLVGLGLGVAAAVLDGATGHGLRAAVRGLRDVPADLMFGLKPSGSVLALLLPLALAVPGLPVAARWAAAVAGGVVALTVPGEAARLSILAGLAAGAAAWAVPAVPRLLGGALAILAVSAPLTFGALLDSRIVPADRLGISGAHRLIVWDFALRRIADRPVTGWGMDSSRAIPGGQDRPDAAALERMGFVPGGAMARAFAPDGRFNVLPLHPHNGLLQVWLELGAVGAVLAGTLLLSLGLAAGRLPRPARAGATGALAAAAVTGLLSYGVWQPWWVGGLLLAAVTVAALAPAGAEVTPTTSR